MLDPSSSENLEAIKNWLELQIANVKIHKGNWRNEPQMGQKLPIPSMSLEMVRIYRTPKAYRLTKAQKTVKLHTPYLERP